VRPKNVRRAKAAKAEKILRIVSRRRNIDVKSLRTNSARFSHFVEARREFCLLADAAGIGARIIAKALWCTPHTVRYHLKPAIRQYRSDYYRARREAAATQGEHP